MFGSRLLLLKMMYSKSQKMHKVTFKKQKQVCCQCGMDMVLKTRIVFGTDLTEDYFECNTCGHFCK